MNKIVCLCACMYVIAIQSLSSQHPDTLIWQISTTDGNEFYGAIVEESKDSIKLKTKELGMINIKTYDIKKRQLASPSQDNKGKYWPENIYSSRYFWAPNGYGLKKGEGYYQNIWILFNQVSYGFTDNFSVGIGTIPLFLFGAFDYTPFWITPKISIPIKKDKLNAGAGLMFVFLPGEINSTAGIAYGNLSFGSRDKNATIGLGYGFSDGEFSSYPTLNLSGMIRTGKRSYLITENYFFGVGDDPLILIMIGGRWTGNGIAIDYGGFRPILQEGLNFIAFPWLGIHVPFGRKSVKER